MNESSVKRASLLITVIVAGVFGLSILLGSYLIPFAVVVAGLVAMRFIMSKAKREGIVLEDERLELIASKASDGTFRVVVVALAVIGLALEATSNALGEALLYVCCSMLMLYLIFYSYYASRLGGL